MLDLKRYDLSERWPKLRALQEEVASLERERQRAEREVMARRQAVQGAKEQDAAAAAKAIRAGKSIPAAKQERQAHAALEDAERSLSAYAKAAQDAQSDLGAFRAKHAAELYAEVQDALRKKARRLSECVQEASALYAILDDSRHDLRNLEPPQQAEEFSGPPQRLTTSFIGLQTTRQAGPDRGHVEGVLGYLATLEGEYAAEDEAPDAAA